MKDKARWAGCLVVFAIAVLLSACGGASEGGSHANSLRTSVPMRVATDDLGRRVTMPVKISRAVSLAPSVTESIFAVGAGDRLVGVTTFCNYPEQAKLIAKVGDTMNPNMESIVALKPDVVFVSTASQVEAFTRTLEQNGIAVYVINSASLAEVYRNLLEFGIIFDTQPTSQAVVESLQNREYFVQGAVGSMPLIRHGQPELDKFNERLRVFVQISREPLFTVGRASFINQLITQAGGTSVTAEVATAYPKLSKETALALNPDAIILSESDDNLKPNEVLSNSPAVRNGRVYKVNADLLSRPGPRLVDALEQIARALHPEKFTGNYKTAVSR